jgi:HSP20 family protein
MAIERWRPFRLLYRRWPEEEMEDIFDRFERMFGVPAPRHRGGGWAPLVEMFDRKDEVLMRADLPGVKKEDIRVSVTGDVLSIEGERKAEEEVKEEDYYCCERTYGKFYREILLPAGVKKEKIESEYKDGILEIHIPKAEEVKPKEIEVKVK